MVTLIGLGCIAGLLSGLFGIGGGIIIVPVLVSYFTLASVPAELVMSLASGTSLATMTLTTLTSSLRHHAKGAVNWSILGYLVPGTMLGALLGVKLASHLPPSFLKIFFCVLVSLIGLNMMFGQLFTKARFNHPSRVIWLCLGTMVGIIAGMLGIGGGVLLVPLLCLLGLNLPQAAATSAACTLPTVCIGALSAMWVGAGVAERPAQVLGFVYWPAVGLVGVASILFAWIGVELSHRLPVKVLRRIFGGLLIILVFSWLVFSV